MESYTVKGEGRQRKLEARRARQVNHDPLGAPRGTREPSRKQRDRQIARLTRDARKGKLLAFSL